MKQNVGIEFANYGTEITTEYGKKEFKDEVEDLTVTIAEGAKKVEKERRKQLETFKTEYGLDDDDEQVKELTTFYDQETSKLNAKVTSSADKQKAAIDTATANKTKKQLENTDLEIDEAAKEIATANSLKGIKQK